MKDTESFWDKNASNYSKQPVADEESYQKKLEVTRSYLKPEMSLLELGCGTGSTAIAHSPYVKKIHAIDISSKMIDIANEKAALNNINNIRFEQCDINQLKTSKQSYDVIMGHNILHLLSNLSEAITHAYNLLKKEGFFIINTICLGDSVKLRLLGFLTSLAAHFNLCPRLNIFSTEQLLKLLRDTGFQIAYQWRPQKDRPIFIVAQK